MQQFCTFRVDDLFFGVNVHDVQEVIRYQDMTSVPLAPDVVRGLINLRGQIVVAIDMRTRLGLPDRTEIQPMNVVLSRGAGGVSLLVDEIGDVLTVDADTFEPPPQTVRGVARELIKGIHKLDRQLLLVLDTERAIQLSD